MYLFWKVTHMHICSCVSTWSIVLVSVENLFRMFPRGVVSNNLRLKQVFVNLLHLWGQAVESVFETQTSWVRGRWCAGGCSEVLWPPAGPSTPPPETWPDTGRYPEHTTHKTPAGMRSDWTHSPGKKKREKILYMSLIFQYLFVRYS